MKISELGEDAFLRELRRRLPADSKKIALGIGDDAAAVALAPEERALLSTDTLVEGVHFTQKTLPPRFTGRRAVAVAASDIAAMGGALEAVLLSLVVPRDLEVGALWQIIEGASERARELGGSLVGGNLAHSDGPIVLDVTVCGVTVGKRMLRRSGARPGDAVYITGKIGASGVGLELLRRGAALGPEGALVIPSSLRSGPVPLAEAAIRTHIDPEPRLEMGRLLNRRKLASACIDVSDGVAIDLHRLCEASGVGARIEESALPFAPAVLAWEREWGRDPVARALGSGEDYELLFTVRDEAKLLPPRDKGEGGVALTRIGVVSADEGRVEIVRRDDSVELLDRSGPGMGWDHFASRAGT